MIPQTFTRPPKSRPALGRPARNALLVLGGVAGILALLWLVRGPAFVDRVAITNSTGFDVDVEVSGPGGGLLDLAYVTAGETKVVRGVLDQGEVWIFHFSYGGTDAGTLRVDRSRLEQAGWRVEVPVEVAERLDRAGHEPLKP